MRSSREDHLVLLRAIVKSDGVSLRAAFADPANDVMGFLHFAHRHQLGAYVSWRLHNQELTDELPARAVAAMRASSLVARRRTGRQLRQMRHLADLFEASGVDAMFMKGPLFTQRFYGSLEPRGFSDLDVLIRSARDLDRIEAILYADGYERAYRVLLSRRMSRYFAHHFEYRREGLALDVHWELQRHFTFAFDYARIWETASRVTLEGRNYRTPSDEYALVLQIIGFLTDLQAGQLTLRPLLDIYQILKTVELTLNWDAFFSARRNDGTLRPCRYVLALVLDVLDCHDEFAILDAQVGPALTSLPPTTPAKRAVLESRKVDLGQKLLAFRLYDRSVIAAFAWWLISLPFRVAVYSGPAAATRDIESG